MQNTILIHAPGRRQGRGALVLAYTALFALLMGIWAAIFALNGQSFIQYGDTLKQHYPFLVYYGRWLRQAARCVLTGAAVPTWDFSIGYGADIITTLSYYGLGDPLDLLAAFVPGRWTEQLLEGLIVLRLYLAGLAFMVFSRRHGNSRFGTLLGALAYVFSAWPIQAGLIEPVFLVPMYCFPLMLLGADDLFEGRSPVLYIAAIALTALSNFLFFYMAAVLLMLYAIAVYGKRYGAKNLRTLPPLLAKFIGFALVGIAISAVTLLPTAQELFGSARFGLTRETAPYPFYRFFELLANMTTGMGYDAYSTYAGVTSAAFLGVLVLFAKPRQNTVLKCAWLGLLALLLVPQAGSVLNGISYVSNRWVWAFTMLEAFILARVCPGITAFEPKEKRNLFALLAVYCVVAFCVKQGRTETALLGALLAMLAARLPLMEALLRPLMVTVKSVPVASFIILALIWLSARRLSAFIAFLMVLPIAYGNLLSGLKSTPTQLLEMARLYHVSWGRRLLYIQLPHIKPHLLSALTLALGMSWKAGVAAEVIGIPTGSIGEQLYQSKVYFDLTSLYAWTVAIVLVSVLFEKAVLLAVRLLYGRLERL